MCKASTRVCLALSVSPAAIEAGKLMLMVVMFVAGAVLDDTLYIVGGFVIYNYNNTQYAEPSEFSSLSLIPPFPPPFPPLPLPPFSLLYYSLPLYHTPL